MSTINAGTIDLVIVCFAAVVITAFICDMLRDLWKTKYRR